MRPGTPPPPRLEAGDRAEAAARHAVEDLLSRQAMDMLDGLRPLPSSQDVGRGSAADQVARQIEVVVVSPDDRRPLTIPLSVQFCPDCSSGLLFWHSWVTLTCDRCGAAYKMRGRFDGGRLFAFVCQVAIGALGVMGIASGIVLLQIISGAVVLFSAYGLVYAVLPRDPWQRNALARWGQGASLKPTPAHLAERSGEVLAVGLRGVEPHGVLIPSARAVARGERFHAACPACAGTLVCRDGGLIRCDSCSGAWTTWTTAPLLSWSDRS